MDAPRFARNHRGGLSIHVAAVVHGGCGPLAARFFGREISNVEFEAPKIESLDELIARIDRLMRLGQWEAAELVCREWVTKDPLAPEAWSRSGIVALFRERFEDADIAFGQASEYRAAPILGQPQHRSFSSRSV